MPTLADAKRARLQADAPSTLSNLADLEWNFYSSQSGLTPASKYSITDHKLAYYKLQGSFSGSVNEIETAYFKSQGAVGASFDDLRYDFYTNRQFFLPSALANLELWLEADNISGGVLASDGFDRSKNVFADQDPSFESDVSKWRGTNTTIVQSNAWSASGGNSLLATLTSAAGPYVEGSAGKKPLLANTTYTYSVTVKNNATASRNFVLYVITDPGYTVLGSVGSLVIPAGGVQRLSLTFTTPNTAPVSAWPRVDMQNGAVGETYAIDNIQVELGSKPTAFVWGDTGHLGTTDQGQAWQAIQGTWGTNNGKAVDTTATGGDIAVIDVGTPDVEISETVSSSGSPNLLARYSGPGDLVQITPGGDIWEATGGVWTKRGNGSYPSVVNTLTARLIGPAVTVFGDGVQIGSATLVSQLTQTKVGLRNGGDAIQLTSDNFLVKTPIYSDGAALPVWPDKSGYARHALQATAASQPVFKVNQVNGKPAVQFDGTGTKVLSSPNRVNLGTIFIVYKQTSIGAGDVTLFGENFVASNGLSVATGTNIPYLYDGTTFTNFTGKAINDSLAHVLEYYLTGTTVTTVVDGSQASTGSYTKTSLASMAIGATNGAVTPNGNFVAVIVFSRALSTTERQQVERYLKNKYGTP